MAFSGYSLKASILTIVAASAGIYTAIFTILHINGVIRRSRWPWYWIECISVLIVAVLIITVSSIVMIDFTRGYVLTGVGLITKITKKNFFLDHGVYYWRNLFH